MTERAALLVGASPERMGWDRRGLQNTKRRQDEEGKKSKFAWEGRGMVVVVSCVRHRPILSPSTFTALAVGQSVPGRAETSTARGERTEVNGQGDILRWDGND